MLESAFLFQPFYFLSCLNTAVANEDYNNDDISDAVVESSGDVEGVT